MKKYLALKASAGSGKTFALSVRYITLLLKGANPVEILTLTFTNKAANEMSERIFKTLVTLGEDEVYLNAISNLSQLPQDEILKLKPKIVENFVNSEISIYTIDKFVNKILREFCGYIGVSDDFSIANDNEEELLAKFLLSLNGNDFDSFVKFFLYEDKKFSSIYALFKILIEKSEKIEINEIDINLIELLEEEILKWAFKIKAEIISSENLSNSGKNSLDFYDIKTLLEKGKTWLSKDDLCDYVYFKKYVNHNVETSFIKLKEYLKSYYILKSNYSLNKLLKLFLVFVKFRDTYIKKKNYLEFSDISNLVQNLFEDVIDKDFLYFRLDSKYNHLLIDEFQDTSLLQYKILKPMIEEICAGDGSSFKTFFYVGDTKQSIYRFRGGKRELFDYVASSNFLIEVESLDTNYRSSKEIIDFVNSTFLALPNYEYKEQKYVKNGGFVEIIRTNFEEEPFLDILNTINMLLKKDISPNDIAILTYTNGDVLHIYNYLQERLPNIKISTEMTTKLINQPNVKAVINAIKYLYFKEDIYRVNCNAIVGERLDKIVDFEENLIKKDISYIVRNISLQLEILDENILSFIEICSRYKNIVDFVYEVDFLDATMQSKDSLGIQIMTIFKSKGLEFDTVILLDRIKRKNSDKSLLLFEYGEIELENIYFKVPNLDNFDENYKNALEKEKKLVKEDEINILYVAITRAKNNLFIFKKDENSVFDIINLTPQSRGTLVQNSKKVVENNRKLVEYKPLNLGRQELKITKSEQDIEYSLHSKYFGIATHYCLEMMSIFDSNSLEKAIFITKSKYQSYLNNEDFEDIKNRIRLLINNSFFQELIKDSSFTKEQKLLYKNEIKILDLLIVSENKVSIIDYKTTIDELDTHIYQVAYYKKSIKEILPNKKVSGYIVYLKADEIYFKEV